LAIVDAVFLELIEKEKVLEAVPVEKLTNFMMQFNNSSQRNERTFAPAKSSADHLTHRKALKRS
jgi:hypothetical protein